VSRDSCIHSVYWFTHCLHRHLTDHTDLMDLTLSAHMTCSSPMTLREFFVACSMYSGAVHIFDLSLDPHYVEEISFHDPCVITSISAIEEVVTYLNCPAAHFTDFNDAAAVYIAVVASHPLARQFLPANITAPTRHAPPCTHNSRFCAQVLFGLLE